MTTPSSPARPVRVRFAPSPTGFLHVGGARTALFNWLFARHHGGTMILRIEDTDAERSTQEAIDMILDALTWLGIDWDEGPFIQTQRHARHREVLGLLEKSGAAYRSYVTTEEIDAMRTAAEVAKEPFTYKRGRHEPDAEETKRRAASGMPFVLRLDIGTEGAIVFEDRIRGTMSFRRADVGDLVLSRSDGSMLYNFVCTVDDVDSQITHVIRGEDHLSNTPKQIAIYEALGATPPEFAHVALILGTDKQRLSKRHGATSVQQFREMGILPDAMVNFLALLGWSADDKTEIFSRDDLKRLFSLDRVNPAPAVFDQEKLLFLNGWYIRNAPREEVVRLAREELRREGLLGLPGAQQRGDAWVDGIIGLEVERSRTLRDFGRNLAYFFHAPKEYEPEGVKKFMAKAGSRAIVEASIAAVEAAAAFDAATLEPALRAVAEKSAVNFTRVAQPIRIALTGRTASPPLFDVMIALGRDEVRLRLRQALPLAAA